MPNKQIEWINANKVRSVIATLILVGTALGSCFAGMELSLGTEFGDLHWHGSGEEHTGD